MSEILLQSIQGVLVIIIMVAVGYYLASRHWFNEDSKKLLAKLVTQVALPPYMITSITKDFTKAELFKLLPNLWYPVLSMFILMGLAWLIVRLIHVDPRHQGLFTSMFLTPTPFLSGCPLT